MDPSRLVLGANFVTVSSSVIALSKFRVAYSLPRDRGEGVATGVADEPSRAKLGNAYILSAEFVRYLRGDNHLKACNLRHHRN